MDDVRTGIDQLTAYRRLTEIGNELNSTIDLDTLLKKIMLAAQDICGAEASSVLLLDEAKQELYFRVALGEAAAELKNIRVPVGQGIAGWVAANRAELIYPSENGSTHEVFRDADSQSGFQTKSIACVPVEVDGNLIGVMQVLNKLSGERFSREDIDYLKVIANQAAIALRNTKIVGDLKNFFVNTIELLIMAIVAVDPEASHDHMTSVAQTATFIASQLGISGKDYENIYYASLIHDIGILAARSDDWMSEDRYLHAKRSADLIRNINIFQDLIPLIMYHHEYMDGSGSFRLKGEQIPLGAQIVSISEAWEDFRELARQKGELVPARNLAEFLRCNEGKFAPPLVRALQEFVAAGY